MMLDAKILRRRLRVSGPSLFNLKPFGMKYLSYSHTLSYFVTFISKFSFKMQPVHISQSALRSSTRFIFCKHHVALKMTPLIFHTRRRHKHPKVSRETQRHLDRSSLVHRPTSIYLTVPSNLW